MQQGGRYHALANDEQWFLRCESLEPPMSQLGSNSTRVGRARILVYVRSGPNS
jgi:hypothetical protein